MLRKHWLWLAAGCGLAFVVLMLPVLRQGNWPGEWALVQAVLRARSAAWTPAMQFLTLWGSSAVGVGLSVGYSVVMLVRRRRLDRQVIFPLVAMIGSAPINFGLRAAVGRFRPGVSYIPHRMPELWHPFQLYSFPSGHAMVSLICYGLLAWMLTDWYPRSRPWIVVGYALWVGAIGFSRVYLGVHWPSDVLGGYAIGGCWLALCIGLLGQVTDPHQMPGSSR